MALPGKGDRYTYHPTSANNVLP